MFYIKNIKISNFRCYDNKKFDFDNSINVLVGDNGVGKTSIVEAIGYLAIGKSFRNVKDIDVLKQNEAFFSLVYNIISDKKEEKVVVYFDNKGKKISKNDKMYAKMSDFFAEIGLISFSPDDIKIIKGSPSDRRKYIDLCLCQIDKSYLLYLNNYAKLLKERNELLKKWENSEKQSVFLDVIDAKIAEYAISIIEKRASFISKTNSLLKKYSNILTDNEDKVEMEYIPKASAENYIKELKNRRDHDIYMQTTTCGPHRDDVNFVINDKIASSTASQGQIRSAVLSLKLCFSNMLEQINKNSIIIMDDVLSELDTKRQKQVFKMFNNDTQIFITCTSIEGLSKDLLNNSNIIVVGKE